MNELRESLLSLSGIGEGVYTNELNESVRSKIGVAAAIAILTTTLATSAISAKSISISPSENAYNSELDITDFTKKQSIYEINRLTKEYVMLKYTMTFLNDYTAEMARIGIVPKQNAKALRSNIAKTSYEIEKRIMALYKNYQGKDTEQFEELSNIIKKASESFKATNIKYTKKEYDKILSLKNKLFTVAAINGENVTMNVKSMAADAVRNNILNARNSKVKGFNEKFDIVSRAASKDYFRNSHK